MQHGYDPCEVIVVDNASTDGTAAWLDAEYSEVRIIRNASNLGYAGANNVGFEKARGEFIAVLNPDTEVDADWLTELIDAMQADSSIGLATPKLLQMDRPNRINACGNEVTPMGLTFCRGLDEHAAEFPSPEIVSAVSGAAFVIRREVLRQIGPFDESFFMYFEDTDLSLRAQLAGFKCLYVPRAVVRHQYRFKLSPRKCFYQERNRYLTLLRTFRWPTLLVLLPALLLSEAIVWGYLLSRGPRTMWAKLTSYAAFIRALPQVIRQRQSLQMLRRVTDREILKTFGHRLTLAQTASPWVQRTAEWVINPVLMLYATLLRMVVRW
jgi:GT2 family glycosyltransferase